MRKKNPILSSWLRRRDKMQELADLTRDAQSWTAAEKALSETCKAELQIATLEAVEAALKMKDPAQRFAALHGLYLRKDQPKEAAAYARLESELVNQREQREHERSVAALEHVDDVAGSMAAELHKLPAADLVQLRDQIAFALRRRGA
jgi:hypothetical protein